ncbi:MAG TPA: signal peptide peptidase SppA [Rhodocyclaceae bacterium]|nr:signal peptide peptidase SppA [Rhodocyclaceae bacterium]
MPSPKRSLLRRSLAALWSALDAGRRVVFNLIFLALVVGVLAALFLGGPPKLGEKTTLIMNLGGPLVEQRSGGVADQVSEQLMNHGRTASKETQLRDVLAVLDAAAKEPKIGQVLLMLDDFSGAGLAGLREVAGAIERFKASGKKVVAWGSSYNQGQYYVAAHADEVWLHPMGLVHIEGYGRYRNYYRDALDRVGVSANVIRVGAYKNFGEPYFADGPSKETIESESYLYQGLWNTYLEGVEKARKLPAGSVMHLIDELPQRFAAVEGDTAKLALNNHLVDRLMTRDELRQTLIERGSEDKEKKTFRQIAFADYLATLEHPRVGDAIGVVVAEGEISEGREPAGHIGGLSTAELIRKARDDDKIKAIVLRVNSPGGSAFGSELIRRELDLTRKAGKPVVVSMGSVAASGGYWITMSADEVIADPATITGSIGVFAMLPTAEKAMEKLSIKTGGVTTTWLGTAYDPRRGLDPRMRDIVQGAIGKIYRDFTTLAAEGRHTTPDKIDAVAQGRVWTGAQAKERGLVDKTGSFADALTSARERAKLPETARVAYVEPELSPFERLTAGLNGQATQLLAEHLGLRVLPAAVPGAAAADVTKDFVWLAEMADRSPTGMPFMALTHCLCGR